ncbi:hypothetical protein N9066_00300 [bacterium]|nr:hypothetical protein [bacterium]
MSKMFRYSPWLSDQAIRFLNNLLRWWPTEFEKLQQSGFVFEFGGGSSTFWMLRKGLKVVTFETNPEYLQAIILNAQASHIDHEVISCESIIDLEQQLQYSSSQLFIIESNTWDNIPKWIFSSPKTMAIIDDGDFRLDVFKAWNEIPNQESLLILDNVEYCSDSGVLPIGSAYPERSNYYRQALRSSENKCILFEQETDSKGRGYDSVGDLQFHRSVTGVIWKADSLLSKCLLTDMGYPLVSPENNKDQDLASLRSDIPYPNDEATYQIKPRSGE